MVVFRKIILIGLISFLASSFTRIQRINKCYTDFAGNDSCTLTETRKTALYWNSYIQFPTSKGTAKLNLKDGYELTYNNVKGAVFAQITLELTDSKDFKEKWLDRCQLHAQHHAKAHNDTLNFIRLDQNNYEIWGSSAEAVDNRPLLAIFYLFVNDKFLITFRFPNAKPGERTFESIEEFERERNRFIEQYTTYIRKCENQ